MPISLDDEAAVKGRRALVIDDGPTITHGGMPHGAAYVAAVAAGAIIIDPRSATAAPTFQRLFKTYPHIGKVLPAVGYNPDQLRELETTINAADAEVVVAGNPVDLSRLLRLNKPIIRARYEFAERGEPKLSALIDAFLEGIRSNGRC